MYAVFFPRFRGHLHAHLPVHLVGHLSLYLPAVGHQSWTCW